MRRGDVVEIDWQFSDLTGSKLRPAVVVQADFLDGLIDDTTWSRSRGVDSGSQGPRSNSTQRWKRALASVRSATLPARTS